MKSKFNKRVKSYPSRNTIMGVVRKYGSEKARRILKIILAKERSGEIQSMESTIRLRALFRLDRDHYTKKLGKGHQETLDEFSEPLGEAEA